MKKILFFLFTLCVAPSLVEAQKPSYQRYKADKVNKLSISQLQIPVTAGKDMMPEDLSNHSKREPASIRDNVDVSISAACTHSSGMNVSNNDPNYGECIDESSVAKKVILDDPTQSVFMNIQIDKFDLNPFY